MKIYTMLDVNQGLCSMHAHLTEKGAIIHAITNLFVYLEIKTTTDLESFLTKSCTSLHLYLYREEVIAGVIKALKEDITLNKPLDLSERSNKDLRILFKFLSDEIDYLDLGIMVEVDNSELQL